MYFTRCLIVIKGGRWALAKVCAHLSSRLVSNNVNIHFCLCYTHTALLAIYLVYFRDDSHLMHHLFSVLRVTKVVCRRLMPRVEHWTTGCQGRLWRAGRCWTPAGSSQASTKPETPDAQNQPSRDRTTWRHFLSQRIDVISFILK